MKNLPLAQELVKLAKELTAAEDITFADMPVNRQELILKVFKQEPDECWFGIHGYIASFKGSHGFRLPKESVKALVNSPVFRWIEGGPYADLSVGL